MAGNHAIGEVLGELVSRQVDRYRSKRLRQGQLEPSELVDPLEDARRQQQHLALIVERLDDCTSIVGGTPAVSGPSRVSDSAQLWSTRAHLRPHKLAVSRSKALQMTNF